LGSTLPVSFVTWVNPLVWILTPMILVENNTYWFWYKGNCSPKNGIRVIGLEFKTHPTCSKGGNCWTLNLVIPMSFVTWVKPLSCILNPTIVAETNAYGFWYNGNDIPIYEKYNKKENHEIPYGEQLFILDVKGERNKLLVIGGVT
jgi:hypothetical protein